ncbi:hypothetical protein HPB52_000391 [Rhipicephalus sanguineus]|uniref:Uncharacterized protein n=1 Tax=Rhipicephalus sanguineus TaxID=34632 RepID=A0A9D4SRN2_RHISA|nr:hypothetical protein HPB52_000391 [Rhipicephalus sanguineus]
MSPDTWVIELSTLPATRKRRPSTTAAASHNLWTWKERGHNRWRRNVTSMAPAQVVDLGHRQRQLQVVVVYSRRTHRLEVGPSPEDGHAQEDFDHRSKVTTTRVQLSIPLSIPFLVREEDHVGRQDKGQGKIIL